jgi:hypothetical protein
MPDGSRVRNALLPSLLAAGVGAVVWLGVSYAQAEPLDIGGAATFFVGFGVVFFVLQYLRG